MVNSIVIWDTRAGPWCSGNSTVIWERRGFGVGVILLPYGREGQGSGVVGNRNVKSEFGFLFLPFQILSKLKIIIPLSF